MPNPFIKSSSLCYSYDSHGTNAATVKENHICSVNLHLLAFAHFLCGPSGSKGKDSHW